MCHIQETCTLVTTSQYGNKIPSETIWRRNYDAEQKHNFVDYKIKIRTYTCKMQCCSNVLNNKHGRHYSITVKVAKNICSNAT